MAAARTSRHALTHVHAFMHTIVRDPDPKKSNNEQKKAADESEEENF